MNDIKEKAERLEALLRQRRFWVIESHPDSRPMVEGLHQEVADLKAELGVTDEAAWLSAR